MATAQTKSYEAASTPVQVGRGTVATHALTFAVDDTGTVDVLAMGSIINTGNPSETWSITPPPMPYSDPPRYSRLAASRPIPNRDSASAPMLSSSTPFCVQASLLPELGQFAQSGRPAREGLALMP